MAWTFTSDAPIYQQAARALKLRILTGAYSPGGDVPSVRELAQEAAVNPNTMQKALRLLEQEGLLTTQRTAGRRVTEDRAQIESQRQDLARTYLKDCWERLAALGYGPEEIRTLMKEASL